MLRRHYSLILMAFWIMVGVCLIFPEILPEKAREQLRVPSGGMIGALALVFAVYNLARWWAYQSLYRNRAQARAENPLAVRRIEQEPEKYEPNPELNFLRPDGDATTSRD